ncbi:hypothetical protein BDP27DRAFT_1361134 [Rhodocollybia butyracea]|uniref:DUF7330 domain-containing protein n=1 Tax=Rhodocollybia butyracea TaxID=206335 RepID=A0A9P5UBN2_9AGAR|nr:hypothetical protein BDP27DRAFT_1361134 [Rhodocollybia butyracea]
MIVTDPPDSPIKKSSETSPPDQLQDAPSPPPYTSLASPSTQIPFVLPQNIKPSNFLSFTEAYNSIEGTHVIDSSLDIPSEWLPPLPEGEAEETRSNFYAKSAYGNVTSELYLLDKPVLKGRRKLLMNVSSTHASVSVCIHREGLSPPYNLNASSSYGNVTVRIPRSFKGLISASTKYGRVLMSDAVSGQALSVFSGLQGVKRIFIGDLSARNELMDDVIVLDSWSGTVKLFFEDEETSLLPTSLTGLFSRFFS